MPLILAVDTTGEYGSLALVRDGELLEEALLHAPGSFSPVLYDELERLLREGHQHEVHAARIVVGRSREVGAPEVRSRADRRQ